MSYFEFWGFELWGFEVWDLCASYMKRSDLVGAEVPMVVVTETGTVPLPEGEVARISWAFTTVKRAACEPKRTFSTWSNQAPRITTVVPPAVRPAAGDSVSTFGL